MIEEGNHTNGGGRQDLALSDYDAFIKKSKEENRTDYPSAFNFIKISPISDAQLGKLPKEDISPLNCTRAQLINLCVQILMQNSFAKSNFNPSALHSLITQIAQHYNSVSYHNFTHGFALMQMLYKCFKLDSKLAQIYSDEQLTYYLIAGITHDVNHPGTNNIYEEKLKTELARVAGNDSILEKMHLRTFMAICQSKPEFDVIGKSKNPQATRQKITRAILATDMKKHFGNLKLIEDKRKQNKLDFQNEEVKLQFMENLVHACDIGNGLLLNQEYMTWGGLLTYEFNEQTKLEAKNNVPVTEFLRYKGIVSFYDDQIGFLGTFVLPLWKEITVSFQGIAKMYANCEKNLASIKTLKQKDQK